MRVGLDRWLLGWFGNGLAQLAACPLFLFFFFLFCISFTTFAK
jgi:hypothetical protein